MKKMIEVSIGYMDFNFDDVDSAVKFAETALATLSDNDKDRKVCINIKFAKEDE